MFYSVALRMSRMPKCVGYEGCEGVNVGDLDKAWGFTVCGKAGLG